MTRSTPPSTEKSTDPEFTKQIDFIDKLTYAHNIILEQIKLYEALAPKEAKTYEIYGVAGTTVDSPNIIYTSPEYSDDVKIKISALKKELSIIKNEIDLRNSKVDALDMPNSNIKDEILKNINSKIYALRDANPSMYDNGKSLVASPCILCHYKDLSKDVGFPTIVAPPSANDGSGLFASETPTENDKDAYNNWNIGGILGVIWPKHRDATKHMRHYLSASGAPLKVSVEDVMDDMPELSDAVNDELSAIVEGMKKEFNGNTATKEITTAWKVFPDEKNLTYQGLNEKYSNWYYAMGKFSYSVKATATIIPPSKSGESPKVNIDYNVYIFDRYNWDGGKSVNIMGFQVKDEELARFHKTGLAQEYVIYGIGSKQNKVMK